MNPRCVAVLGASSQIGLFSLPMLAARGWQVLAVSRKGQPPDYPDLASVRWLASEEPATVLPSVQALLSAGPMALALQVLASQPGVERSVVFSTSSVLSKAGSPDPEEQQMAQSIAAGEAAITELCNARASALCILRPTLVYGCGMDRNLSLLLAFIRRFGWLPISARAQGLRQPVHALDLALAAVHALAPDAPHRLQSELCGGSTLAYRDMVRRLFAVVGKPVRLLEVPATVLAGMVGLAGHTPWGRGLRASMAHRQSVDLVFDDSKARSLLGVSPRPFEPGMADFQRPSPQTIIGLAK